MKVNIVIHHNIRMGDVTIGLRSSKKSIKVQDPPNKARDPIGL